MSPSANPQPTGVADAKVTVVVDGVDAPRLAIVRYGWRRVDPKVCPNPVLAPRKADFPDAMLAPVSVVTTWAEGNAEAAENTASKVPAAVFVQVGNDPVGGVAADAGVGPQASTATSAVATPTSADVTLRAEVISTRYARIPGS
jgi:hypothetical protein